MNKEYIDVKSLDSVGYKPIDSYENWLVAVLNYTDEYLPQNITTLQKHVETDEIFVLLKGGCVLFSGGNDKDKLGEITAVNMEPMKLYNVKRATWHSHTLSKDGSVLIVENKDTTDDNSFELELNADQKKKVVSLAKELLG